MEFDYTTTTMKTFDGAVQKKLIKSFKLRSFCSLSASGFYGRAFMNISPDEN